MSEMDKLEEYLKSKNIRYWRGNRDDSLVDKFTLEAYGLRPAEQIIVYNKYGFRQWDAVYGPGTYGYERGLLEAMGKAVTGMGDDNADGYLTAEEIIKRLEGRDGNSIL